MSIKVPKSKLAVGRPKKHKVISKVYSVRLNPDDVIKIKLRFGSLTKFVDLCVNKVIDKEVK